MGLTPKQQFYKCCGFFCGMLACIGVYFFAMISWFQFKDNVYMIEELEGYKDLAAVTDNKFLNAFLITMVLNALCCVSCFLCGTCVGSDADEEEYYDDIVARGSNQGGLVHDAADHRLNGSDAAH